MRYYYLESQAFGHLDAILQDFVKSPATRNLSDELTRVLPIEKWNDNSFRSHIEGMYYLSEELWQLALRTGKSKWGDEFTREKLMRITRPMPMSHYRYLMGSREPVSVLLTRNDALQDPPTAMVKLQNDIESLTSFLSQTIVEA